MKLRYYFAIPIIILTTSIFILSLRSEKFSPVYSIDDSLNNTQDLYSWINNWKRPDGPVKVALQVGHKDAKDQPDELKALRNSTGTKGGGKFEYETNEGIVNKTAEILRSKNIEVEILPATIPSRYYADVFVAVHADGNNNLNISGFKVSPPRRDFSGKSTILANMIQDRYQLNTNMAFDDNITRNMRGYYAFSFWRYEHTLHPMTPAIIIETGFLTSPKDQMVIIKNQHLAAKGIAEGILLYLKSQNLITAND